MHMPCKKCICAGVYKRNNVGGRSAAPVVGRLIKKERNPVKIKSSQGYAQQEVHPCPLDNKGRQSVAPVSQLRLLNMLHSETLYA
jgi:hypothetical protein